jgi:hypothetical protein
MTDKNFPFVSCICPTYNRQKFLPYLIQIYNSQDYPKNRRELIILDDSTENNEHIINQYKKDNNIRYIYSKEKISLGKKRNMLNKYALEKAEYIFCFDDDDFYPPNRIKYGIHRMLANKSILSGSSILHIYITDLNKIYEFGPYGKNHCTNGTMAYHKSFLLNHTYDDNANKAEERFFLNNYDTKVEQLDPLNVMLCISHNSNTVDKKKLLYTGKETCLTLNNFIKNKTLLNFYKSLYLEAQKQDIIEEKKSILDIDIDNPELSHINDGLFLSNREFINTQLQNEYNNKLSKNNTSVAQPVINMLENILKKYDKKELVELDVNKKLNLVDVLSGSIKISKEYIIKMIEILEKKDNNNNIKIIIDTLNHIKVLQSENKLDSNVFTPINEYNDIYIPPINNNIKSTDTSDTSEKLETLGEMNSFNINDIIKGKTNLSIDKINKLLLLRNNPTIPPELLNQLNILNNNLHNIPITNTPTNNIHNLNLTDIINENIYVSEKIINYLINNLNLSNLDINIKNKIEHIKILHELNLLKYNNNNDYDIKYIKLII